MDGDRKYRQHGYQDSHYASNGARSERPKQHGPKLPIDVTGPKLPRLVQNVVAARCFNCAIALPPGCVQNNRAGPVSDPLVNKAPRLRRRHESRQQRAFPRIPGLGMMCAHVDERLLALPTSSVRIMRPITVSPKPSGQTRNFSVRSLRSRRLSLRVVS